MSEAEAAFFLKRKKINYLYYILKIVSLNIDQFFNQMKKSKKYLTYFNLHV
jgi:hypothetical protein